MDESDIKSVINMYVEAGKRAEQAGFDLLEVSAGDDTLPIQFLEARFNRRTDRYGGGFANRSRFYIELLHALKQSLGDRCAITTRFEMDTLHGPEGVEAHEDGVRMLELLRREGVVDLVALKIGDYAEWGEDAGASRYRKSGWMTPFIKQGKSILGAGIPVVGNGRLTSPDDMVALIRGGVLDIIGAAGIPRSSLRPRAPAACSWSAAVPRAWNARACWASAATRCTCAKPRASSAGTGGSSRRSRASPSGRGSSPIARTSCASSRSRCKRTGVSAP
jgi:hypothetical protein